MSAKFRKLNEAGITAFRNYIRDGAEGPPPVQLLENPETSAPLPVRIEPGSAQFDDRYMFGVYLNTLLKGFDAAMIGHDAGLWDALALHWFDRICPPDSQGKRSPGKEYRYLLSSDFRNYYRHLVRSPWSLVRDHGENARILLIAPKQQTGVAGSGRGSARRFGLVLRQLDLTYDPECMTDSAFIGILPDEFEKWRKQMAAGQSKVA